MHTTSRIRIRSFAFCCVSTPTKNEHVIMPICILPRLTHPRGFVATERGLVCFVRDLSWNRIASVTVFNNRFWRERGVNEGADPANNKPAARQLLLLLVMHRRGKVGICSLAVFAPFWMVSCPPKYRLLPLTVRYNLLKKFDFQPNWYIQSLLFTALASRQLSVLLCGCWVL